MLALVQDWAVQPPADKGKNHERQDEKQAAHGKNSYKKKNPRSANVAK
jgi:hypothetical protein